MVILLIILAVLVGVPLILIFTPVRYRVAATVGDGYSVRVRVSYLLHLIHITVNYSDKKLDSTVRIAGIKMKPRKAKPPKPKPAAKAKPPKHEEPSAGKPKPSAGTPEPVKKSLRERLSALRTLLTRKDLKTIIDILIRCVKKLIKHLLPKRFSITGTVGFNDPYHTGLLIGGIYAASGALSKRQYLRIAGDFDKPALRLTVTAAGRVSLAGLLSPLIWLVSRKPVFNLLVEQFRQRKIKDKG
jgi:hypothetical protein